MCVCVLRAGTASGRAEDVSRGQLVRSGRFVTRDLSRLPRVCLERLLGRTGTRGTVRESERLRKCKQDTKVALGIGEYTIRKTIGKGSPLGRRDGGLSQPSSSNLDLEGPDFAQADQFACVWFVLAQEANRKLRAGYYKDTFLGPRSP